MATQPTRINPIILNEATDTITGAMQVNAIHVDPSDTNWEVVLHDAAGGNVVFSASSAANEPYQVSFGGRGTRLKGIYATTLTNAAVYVYFT